MTVIEKILKNYFIKKCIFQIAFNFRNTINQNSEHTYQKNSKQLNIHQFISFQFFHVSF